jgi:fructosamine-3-kinase
MTVPPSLVSSVESVLEERAGHPVRIRSSSLLGGGCINPSARLETEKGEAFFLKWNHSADPEMFPAEADGLRALNDPGALRVPEVIGWGGDSTSANPGWLLLEFVPRGAPVRAYGHLMGGGLARLHSSGGDDPATSSVRPQQVSPPATATAPDPGLSFGWHRENFIGSLPQANRTRRRWGEFWRDLRIEPQFRLSRELGYFEGKRGEEIEILLDRMEAILPPEAGHGPALLHGDLWSGNYFPDASGAPVLIDPATYRGEGEVDLAMMELFGSFPTGFLDGYGAVRPIPPEYEAYRRDLYQLYYLLVHVNLFGGGYVGGSLSAARRVLSVT